MSDSDWVNDYMKSWGNDDRRRDAELRQAEFVKAGRLALFRLLWDQVEADVTKFHNAGGDSRLRAQFIPSSGLWVTRREFPMVELKVTLEEVYIAYVRRWKFDDASDYEEEKGQFTVTSDLQGRLQVRKNGKPFNDHAELSKFLLIPVFEYLKENR
ncbi:MAG: hypothetical protein ABSF46_21210 [Terriglobia bacterium]|jgi:hypothetical protein